MKITSFEEFKELAQRGTFVPVYKEIVADMLTPVSAFLKVAEHSDYAFLLESVEGGEQVGRYSFLGKDPVLILRSRGGKTTVDRMGEATESEKPLRIPLPLDVGCCSGGGGAGAIGIAAAGSVVAAGTTSGVAAGSAVAGSAGAPAAPCA